MMDPEVPSTAATVFADVSVEDVATGDPMKQIPALYRLLFDQCNGKECNHQIDLLVKHCFAAGPGFNKEVRMLAYSAIKNMTLPQEQWSKISTSFLPDLNGQDLEVKISAIEVLKYMPTATITELFNAGVDLLGMARNVPKTTTSGPDPTAQLRCAAIETIASLLLNRNGLPFSKTFNLSAWSLMADRILYDPSRRVFKVAVETVAILCAILYRRSRHIVNESSQPVSAKPAGSGEMISSNSGMSLVESFDSKASSLWLSGEGDVVPLTPSTVAAVSTVAVASMNNTTSATKPVATSLDKIGHVLFVKLMPHLYTIVNRCRTLDPVDLPPALILISCLLQQLEPLTSEHSNIQVHFMTSPKHLISEIVETFLFPLLYSKDEALVFEAASNLISITQANASLNPGWPLAACRALIGLLSRDSVRSVVKRIIPVLLASLKLLSPGVILPVLILTLQQVHKLQLPSSQRLPVFYRLIHIPIQLCDTALEPVTFFTSFIKHPWVTSLILSTEEDAFREDLMGTLMKALFEHWSTLQGEGKSSTGQGRVRSRSSLVRTHSDSESSSAATHSGGTSTRSKHLSSTTAHYLSGMGSSGSTANSGGSAGSSSLSGSSSHIHNPEDGHSAHHPHQYSHSKRVKQWREVLYLSVLSLVKCLQWKTHVRTFCQLIYLNLFDAVGQALSFSRSARPQLRDLVVRVVDAASHLKSDAVCLRYYYVAMKHALDTGMTKLVDTVYKSTQTRFLAFLDVSASNSTDRALGYRVNQLRKTTLSPNDLEVLVLLLQMFSKHPAVATTLLDEEGGGGPKTNPKLIATLHYIDSIKKYKGDDPVSVDRYEHLPEMPSGHNLYNLAAASSKFIPTATVAPLSPRSSATAANTSANSGHHSAKAAKRMSTKDTEQVFKGLDGAKTYIPPIEYLTKEVSEKHPDDEFLLTYSKSRLPDAETLDAELQMEIPTFLTSPSDPFMIQAYHVLNVGSARVTLYLRLTNLTNFQVPKVMLFVDTKGRLEPFNSLNETHTEFSRLDPGETVLWNTAFKVNHMHVNELIVRLVLVPQAAKPSQTLDLQCLPYRINMHVMALPWLIHYSDFLREWTRYTVTTSFKVYLDRAVNLTQLDEAISDRYQRQLSWSYNDTHQTAYSGISWWDERLLFSIFASRDDDDSPYQLKIEVRTSTPNLGVIIETNKDDWLRDLLPLVPHWFTLASDLNATALWGGAEHAPNKPDNAAPVTAPSALDEKLMLDQWSKSRIF